MALGCEGAALKGPAMLCPFCHSGNIRKYTAEMNIHFPGMKGLNIPTVWVFPRILVCLDCGQAQLTIPEAERKQLRDRGLHNSGDGTAA
jgi:hypothetical protein